MRPYATRTARPASTTARATGCAEDVPPEVVQAVALRLADDYVEVRKAAAKALARLGRDAVAAVPGLVLALHDHDAEVRCDGASTRAL